MDKSSYHCKICANPVVSELWTGDNPQTAVCSWTCASILNSKLIYLSVFVGTVGIFGSIIIFYWFLLIFIPVEIFGVYSLYLILKYKDQREELRKKFVGEEDPDKVNKYTR